MTRAKNKIYFALEKNNDEIHKRFGAKGLVEYCPDIKINLSHDKIVDFIDKEKVIELLKNNDIEEPPSDKKNNVTIMKYQNKINDIKNNKIKKSIMELTKVFKKK